jgi:hypothetical protein
MYIMLPERVHLSHETGKESLNVAQKNLSSEKVKQDAEKAARKVRPWVGWVARTGYVAKGVIYVTIGLLAMQEALGAGGRPPGPNGAMRSIESQPFGRSMLALLALGLVGYALWKLLQGIMDPDDKGSDAHGILRRIGYVGSGAIHGVLAFIAAQSIMGEEDTSEDVMMASALVYQPPFGQLVVGLVGLIAIGVGFYQLYAAYEAKFRGELKLDEMSSTQEKLVTLAGRIGTAARGLAIGAAGAFVILAAYRYDPSQTRGLDEALEALQRQPLGSYMLETVAMGLLVYGVFMLLVAYYRRIDAT